MHIAYYNKTVPPSTLIGVRIRYCAAEEQKIPTVSIRQSLRDALSAKPRTNNETCPCESSAMLTPPASGFHSAVSTKLTAHAENHSIPTDARSQLT